MRRRRGRESLRLIVKVLLNLPLQVLLLHSRQHALLDRLLDKPEVRRGGRSAVRRPSDLDELRSRGAEHA